MSTDIEHLAARIGDTLSTDTANMPPWLWRPLLHLLASGEPVTVDDLAAATGRTADQVRDALAGLPDTEYDQQGRIIGHGITLRPTPHHFTVDGRQLGRHRRHEVRRAVGVAGGRCGSLRRTRHWQDAVTGHPTPQQPTSGGLGSRADRSRPTGGRRWMFRAGPPVLRPLSHRR